MNRINELFGKDPHGLLSIYFCAGAPTLDGTAEVIRTLERNGVNMIEIGIPFSDPMADGPVIQNAATKALRNGMSLKLLFSQLKDIRRDVKIPLILMGYLNPIYQYGFENFCRSCKECGIDGAIIPDLPFRDYESEYKAIAQKYDIRIIMLITPETSDERIRQIDAHTDGFIYMVSSLPRQERSPISMTVNLNISAGWRLLGSTTHVWLDSALVTSRLSTQPALMLPEA
jgi:tryptophan synthase alpha chain